MKHMLLLLIFPLSCGIIKAQVIRGTIIEEGTGKPLVSASIYFDGTFKATSSDSKGNFILKFEATTRIPIIISYIGYVSQRITDYTAGETLKISLKPKVYQLDEVQISYSDGMSRKEKLQLFKKEFLGTTSNAKDCEITNEDDIRLSYNMSTRTLSAFCDKPILINNKSLGYKITYFLDNFTRTDNNLFYSGNYFFEEDSLVLKTDLKIQKKREEAYLDSRMYFLRSLWANSMEKDGFVVYKKTAYNPVRIKYDDLILSEGGIKYLKPNGHEVLQVLGKKNKQSRISIADDSVYIERTGFSAMGLYWDGSMAEQRIADLLPYEYSMQ